MFERVHFMHYEAKRELTSKMVSEKTFEKKEYSKDNLTNADFRISGSVDSFPSPLITDYARKNLFYMQAFSIFHYDKGSYTRRQNYPSYLILYTYHGTGRVEYLGKSLNLTSGDGILIDCRKPHYYEAVTNWDVAVFHFNGPLAGHYSDEYVKYSNLKFHEETEETFHTNLEKLLSIYGSPRLHRELRASHRIESILLYLLMLHSNSLVTGKKVPTFVEATIGCIETNYAEDLSLQKLSEEANVSKYYLSREFKRYTGFSPHDYLIKIRLQQATLLLKTTDLTCGRIGALVGIPDQNNFTYLFKKEYKVTPAQYRNSADLSY